MPPQEDSQGDTLRVDAVDDMSADTLRISMAETLRDSQADGGPDEVLQSQSDDEADDNLFSYFTENLGDGASE